MIRLFLQSFFVSILVIPHDLSGHFAVSPKRRGELYMEERKKFAKEIQKTFDKRMTPFLAILGGLLLVGLAGSLIPSTIIKIIGLIILGIIYFIVMGVVDRLEFGKKIMYCRALVGKEISDDPISEGLERVRKFGTRNLKRYRRECGRIFYTVGRGAMTVGEMMDQVPYLNKLSGLYKKIVKRLIENSSKILITYQLGCYDEADQEQFYDLVTYFVQDGKNFLLKTVKSEFKDFIKGEVSWIIMVPSLLAYAFTKNIIFAIIALAIFIVSIVLSYNEDDFDILCDYIEYVDTHELNTDLKNKLVVGVKTGNSILDFTKAYKNPTDYNMRKAVNGAEDLIGNIEKRF